MTNVILCKNCNRKVNLVTDVVSRTGLITCYWCGQTYGEPLKINQNNDIMPNSFYYKFDNIPFEKIWNTRIFIDSYGLKSCHEPVHVHPNKCVKYIVNSSNKKIIGIYCCEKSHQENNGLLFLKSGANVECIHCNKRFEFIKENFLFVENTGKEDVVWSSWEYPKDYNP